MVWYVVSPGDSTLKPDCRTASNKSVLQDKLSVLQDFDTWTPLPQTETFWGVEAPSNVKNLRNVYQVAQKLKQANSNYIKWKNVYVVD